MLVAIESKIVATGSDASDAALTAGAAMGCG
jgi:hypothetical protein